MTPKADSAKKKAKAEREARLAEALRANLRRRKATTSPPDQSPRPPEDEPPADQGDKKA